DAVSTYTPEKTAEITWLDAERIEEAARMYATTKPACFHWFAATDQVGRNSTRIEQMRVILRAITGNIDVTGGETLPGVGPMINGKIAFVRGAYLQLDEKCPPEQRRKQIGSDRFKLQLWTEWEVTNRYYEKYHGVKQAMVGHNMQAPYPYLYSGILKGEPYPIKALITWTSDPMVHAPATKTLYKALKSPNLELHVVLEHWMTPAAQLADYVLPIATKLERPYVDCFEDFEAHVWTSEAVVKPMGERRNDYDFWKDLASRLGQGEYFPWRNIEEVVNYRLAPSGLSLKEAARRGIITSPAKTKRYLEVDANTRGPRGFATPTGRVEIYSTVLETLGYDPLPKYEEPPESPVSTPMLAKEYSLILTTGGRFRPLYHGEYRHLGAGFREQHPHPLVDINLDTARELGIADGDWVWIETRRGRIMQKARATPGIHPRVVNVQHNWWYPELPGEEPWLHGVWISNANVLTSDDLETLDELTGGAHYRAMLCKVYKVQSPTMPSK
ncbi:MAG: molybdopterin-dependent oxidoreductase, partial [Candidatus Bathyarchaeia archaeon]